MLGDPSSGFGVPIDVSHGFRAPAPNPSGLPAHVAIPLGPVGPNGLPDTVPPPVPNPAFVGNPNGLPSPAPGPVPAPSGGVPGPGGGQTDEQNASTVVQHLIAALGSARDVNLRETISTALAAMHKHLGVLQKERQDALAGKLSPRLLEQAHAGNVAHVAHGAFGHAIPAQQLATQGNYSGAAQQWIARHPYAMAHGHIPGYVQQWEQLGYSNAPAAGPTAQ